MRPFFKANRMSMLTRTAETRTYGFYGKCTEGLCQGALLSGRASLSPHRSALALRSVLLSNQAAHAEQGYIDLASTYCKTLYLNLLLI